MLYQLTAIVFPLFALVAVGFFYGRRHLPDMAVANRINLEIFTPALIFSVMSARDFQIAAYSKLALAGVLVVLGSGLIAWPIAWLAGWRIKAFVPPMMFTNSGNMGLPLAVLAFGEPALAAALVLFLVENTLHFTIGNALLEGRIHPGMLLRIPILQATLAGLAVTLLDITVWKPLAMALDLLGQVAIPLMLFALGVRMTRINLQDWRIGLTGAVVCPASGIAIVLLVGPLLGVSGEQYDQLLVFGALPPAVLNFMLAEKFSESPEAVASIVLMGNLASIVTLPAVLAWIL
ncbi:MAG: AEC family transporter [Candidatus Competibacteraceae bacterium]|nr:AEC family transporter [Candidatus Competibacteraceae bacterium]